MKILMLGGGGCQLNAIKKLKEMGHTVILSDYLNDCIGKDYADFWEQVSTFDADANLEIAKKYQVDGVMTLGTDQPIYTAAYVSEKLGLHFPISPNIAKNVTNKFYMKKIFTENNIPTVKYAFIKKDFKDEELKHINFPVVIKPVDSQGQRGIMRLNSISEIRDKFDYCISYSREDKILAEEYYANDELTVNGWVHNGKIFLISVVDRVTLESENHIGICIAHNCPSAHLDTYRKEIIDLTEKITHIFKIKNGPIYYQYLVGKDGLKVNEIACRIGGAYEDITMPIINGFDILDCQIKAVLGEKIEQSMLDKIQKPFTYEKCVSSQLFFAKSGTISHQTDIPSLEKLPYIHKVHYNFNLGYTIPKIENATQRAGFMIISGSNWDEMMYNVNNAFEKITFLNEKNENIIIPYNSYKGKYKFVSSLAD